MSSPVTIGDATLYHADMLDVLPTLPRADVVIADPPYGIGESHKRNATRGKPFGSRIDGKNTRGTFVAPVDYGEYEWDDEPLSPEHIGAILCSAENAVIWGGNYYNLPPVSKWLVWDKQNSGDFADCELAWTNLAGAVRIFRHMWNGMLRASEKNLPRIHPTQKPIALMRWCLQQCGPVKYAIDPCMGSAPVGIACAELGIKYVGIESNARHFHNACERIENAYRQERLFA